MATYHSPAKVNLDLKILGKRDDGFHELSTLMAPLKLHDTLHFKAQESYQLFCDFPGVPLDESNLITKAVRVLEKESKRKINYHITLEKEIPHGAGLAGGSSNAATTLIALNELEQLGYSIEQLRTMAAELGSDIAFFLYESVCKCSGRGEKVETLDLKIDEHLLLVKPDFGVSTPQAYQAWQNSKEINGIQYAPQQMPWGEMVNDLERPVYQKHRFLAELKMWLLQQKEVKAAMMSGSGSTIFAVVDAETTSLEKRLLLEVDPKLWIKKTEFS